MTKIEELAQAVENGRSKIVPNLTQECLDEGIAPNDILAAMIGAMGIVGEKFRSGDIFVPEMLVAAKSMKKGVAVLQPHLKGENTTRLGKAVIGTVYGDLHDIGKNLVAMMIESTGYEVEDLGIDVAKDVFLNAANDPEVTVVAVSALLTTTMPAMEDIVTALNAHPRRASFKIMVGGAPIDQAFADKIGADVYTEDAAAAGQAAKALAMC